MGLPNTWVENHPFSPRVSKIFQLFGQSQMQTLVLTSNPLSESNNNEIDERCKIITFFPRITAPGSPWITMYFSDPRNNPVGAGDPGSAKSFIIPGYFRGIKLHINIRTAKAHQVEIKQEIWSYVCIYKLQTHARKCRGAGYHVRILVQPISKI